MVKCVAFIFPYKDQGVWKDDRGNTGGGQLKEGEGGPTWADGRQWIRAGQDAGSCLENTDSVRKGAAAGTSGVCVWGLGKDTSLQLCDCSGVPSSTGQGTSVRDHPL